MELRPGTATLTDRALDEYIAPGLSSLGRPELPSLAALDSEAASWLPNFLLNHLLRFSPEPRERQFRFALVRRVAAAVSEYELGKAALDEYLRAPSRQVVSPYFHALRHLEAAAASTYQALSLGQALVDPAKPLFDKVDKAAEFGRLERVYVHSRHADDLFDSKMVPRELTLTVWLTHDGLACVEATVTYAELADMLSMLGRIARAMVDPTSANVPAA